MLLKTKDRKNELAPTSVIRGGSIGALPQSGILAPDSDLLAPAFQEMKVQPEMLLKTQDREHGTREYGTRGVQILASALPGTLATVERGAHAPVPGYPGNMLKTKIRQNPITRHQSPFAHAVAPHSCTSRNEGATGDVVENKGTASIASLSMGSCAMIFREEKTTFQAGILLKTRRNSRAGAGKGVKESSEVRKHVLAKAPSRKDREAQVSCFLCDLCDLAPWREIVLIFSRLRTHVLPLPGLTHSHPAVIFT